MIHRGLVKALLLLPGTVLVLIPALIVLATQDSRFAAAPAAPASGGFWLALVCAGAGVALAAWTVTLFLRFGEGTPAPWEPPQRLVIRGPYRYVRNPMITGVLLVLLAESLLLQSWPLATWMALFFAGNAIYFPWVEEKGLQRRFGDAYTRYRRHVPRWIPRLRPYRPESAEGPDRTV